MFRGVDMDFHYEIKNKRLKVLVENKANELGISTDRLIWNYIHRGLFGDYLSENNFKRLHSKEFLKEVNDALGLE